MKPAFGFLAALPPPGARVVPRHDRPGAMRAADARIIVVMQWVVGNFINFDVRPHIGPRPADQWIDLHQLEGAIPLDRLGVRSGGRLVTSDARDPSIESLEDTPERLHFPELTAQIRIA